MKIFIELFAGKAGLCREVRRLGSPALAIEVEDGNHFNVSELAVFQMIIGWVAAGVVWGLASGTPCGTFSRAGRGKPGSGMPGPLRSADHVDGLPNLGAADQQAVAQGNLLAGRAGAILDLCAARGGPRGPYRHQRFLASGSARPGGGA